MKGQLTLLLLAISYFSYALKPDPNLISHPDSIGIPNETYEVKTPDNAVLHVWKLLPPPERDLKKTIVVAYGDAGNKSHWLNQSAILSQAGFTVVLFDYRGFGKSSDYLIKPEQLYYPAFETDLSTIIEWAEKADSNHQIGVWALSMGTIILTQVASSHDLDFVVAEGFVIDPLILQSRLSEQKNKSVEVPFSASSYSENLQEINIPMLIFAGTDDQFMTVQDCHEIANMKSNRKLVEFNGGHLQGFNVLSDKWYGENYIMEILAFTSAVKH